MRSIISLLIATSFVAFTSCASQERGSVAPATPNGNASSPATSQTLSSQDESGAAANAPASTTETEQIAVKRSAAEGSYDRMARKPSLRTETLSLADAQGARVAEAAFDRKVIRNADLILETSSPAEAQRRVASIAEANGGFVVTSDATQRDDNLSGQRDTVIKMVVRVPAAQFGQVVSAFHGMDGHIRQEKISGQDVTEEFIDLEARIRTKKALEAQFLEIMKQTRSVSDALDVQSQLADVRTEIERLEGRKRFLENHAELSTINVSLEPPLHSNTTSQKSFLGDLKASWHDGLNAATAMIAFLVRTAVSLLPVLLLVLPPGYLVSRSVLRARRARFEKPVNGR
jgi:hypothetical protein